MTEQLKDEQAIFLAALEKATPAERAAFIEGACAGNDALRARAENLLRCHAESQGPLDSPPPGVLANVDQPIAERPGSVIGPYKLLEQIGEGGFAVVFMAEQTQPLRRKVALKVLKPGMDTRQVVARLEAERQALAIMDHPNIAQVFDGGATASGRPFFVMELVKGAPITDYCDQNHLTPRARLDLFISVCQAVQHAHQKGVIHRDLKSSNVLVAVHDVKPVVKVIDFGIAKAIGQQLTEKTLFTGFAHLIGTPAYMSPEQAGMSSLDVDTRSDIYSLGVLLYELLTGTTPVDKERFQQAAFDEVRRIIREVDPPTPSTRLTTLAQGDLCTVAEQRGVEPRKLSQQLCGELDWIVMKCLEKDRNRRYETASGLARDIQSYLADEPVQACPPSTWYRLRKLAVRNKMAITTAAVVATALMLGTTISIWQAVRATRAEALAAKRLQVTDIARTEAIRERTTATQRLFQAKLAEAKASRWSRKVGQRVESWRAVTEAADLARELALGEDRVFALRNEAIGCLALTDVWPVKEPWEGFPPGSSAGFGFDLDLERYARSDEMGNISLRRVADDEELARLPGGGHDDFKHGAASIIFSPNGDWLAVTHWGSLPGQPFRFRLWDWRRGSITYQPSFRVHWDALTFSLDGSQLALAQQDGTLTIHEVPSGRELRRIPLGLAPSHLAFHPHGGTIAVASAQSGEVQVRELTSGNLVRKLDAPARARHLAWHPDGVLLAAGCEDKNAYLWDTTTGRQLTVLKGHRGSVGGVEFSPDGDVLLSGSDDGTSRLWDPWTGLELLRFAGGQRRFSRDGRRLASLIGHDLTLWEVTLSRECRSLPRNPVSGNEESDGGDISPDGRWLVVVTRSGVRLWDLAARREIDVPPLSRTADAKFDRTGSTLFTSGSAGLYRWPMHAQPGSLRIGPAEKLPVSGPLGRMSLDRQGRILAVVDRRGGSVIDLDNLSATATTVDHINSWSVAVSQDGRWIATGTHHGHGIKVWDANNGNLVRDLIPQARVSAVVFSPDGRWLVTKTDTAVEIWESESWRPAHKIRTGPSGGHTAVFAPDGKVLAVLLSHNVVQLLDTATWHPFATCEVPNTDLTSWMGFTPDGSQLIVSGRSGAICLWNLRLIRERLREIGLDWELPPYPPVPPHGAVEPIKVELDLGAFAKEARAGPAKEHAK